MKKLSIIFIVVCSFAGIATAQLNSQQVQLLKQQIDINNNAVISDQVDITSLQQQEQAENKRTDSQINTINADLQTKNALAQAGEQFLNSMNITYPATNGT
jgi:hypothetical protein